jgi:hypothetical protein
LKPSFIQGRETVHEAAFFILDSYVFLHECLGNV